MRLRGAGRGACKEAVRVSRVMGAVAWRARALQGCGRASGRAHLWCQPTVDEDVDVESRIRDRGWSRDREPRPVCVWRMGPRGLHARRRLCQSRRGGGVELGRAASRTACRTACTLWPPSSCTTRPKASGNSCARRSIDLCAQGRFGERRDRIQKPCSLTHFLRAVNALVAFERLPDRVAERAELLSRFLESSSYSFER